MGKYQISVKETKEKLKYVKELLKSNLSAEDKEKVQISLFSYLSILNASTNVQLTNFLNQITKGKFSQRGIQECESVAEILVNDYISGFDYVDNHYLEFLIELTNNVAVSDVSDQQFENINISNEQLMQMTRNFYNSFDNKKIKDCFNQVVSKKNSISIVPRPNIFSGENSTLGGICLYDHIFHQPYPTIYKHKNIKDFLILNHEIMHGVDFFMLPKLYTKTYYGFHETPTYTCDYLTIDFLEHAGIHKKEVEKLKNDKEGYFCTLASRVQFQINRRLKRKKLICPKDIQWMISSLLWILI